MNSNDCKASTLDKIIQHLHVEPRAGRVNGGTIVLSREQTERSRTIPSFRKKNERLERVLKNIGTFSKRTERNGTGIA